MLTFKPVPGRPDEHYVFQDGHYLGRVRHQTGGWAYLPRPGLRPPMRLLETYTDAARALARRHAYAASFHTGWAPPLTPGVC
jgi:hypothetical protein